MWQQVCDKWPVCSLEDPLDEDNWTGFAGLTRMIGGKVQIVGDDLLVTNPDRLARDSRTGWQWPAGQGQSNRHPDRDPAGCGNGKKAGFGVIISHRSGETEDSFIADLAVATNAGQIKTGALSRSDRLAKYNQLLRIEEELGSQASYTGAAFCAAEQAVLRGQAAGWDRFGHFCEKPSESGDSLLLDARESICDSVGQSGAGNRSGGDVFKPSQTADTGRQLSVDRHLACLFWLSHSCRRARPFGP